MFVYVESHHIESKSYETLLTSPNPLDFGEKCRFGHNTLGDLPTDVSLTSCRMRYKLVQV